jgi:hypothetical protein
MAVCQPVQPVTDPPPSGASRIVAPPLPHLYRVRLTARRQRLHQVIHHRLAHLTQIMRRPGVLLAAHIHGGFHREFLGVVKQGNRPI